MLVVDFATSNAGKVKSLQRVCERYGIEVRPVEFDLPELQTVDLHAIARGKAIAAYEKLQEPVIVQDSGFFLSAWGGFPGPFAKFALNSMGLEGFLALAKAKPGPCEFQECLAFYDLATHRDRKPVFFDSVIRGSLASEPRGTLQPDSWSALHLVFIPENQKKTIAEMNEGERAHWRRARGDNSAELFAQWYSSLDSSAPT